MGLILVGSSHRTTPTAYRDTISTRYDQPLSLAREIAELDGVQEAFVLSTCNRFEIYLDVADRLSPLDAVGMVLEHLDLSEPILDCFYHSQGPSVVSHLFRVTSGLDSLVLGENEIQGQVKQAIYSASDKGQLGPVLTRLGMLALQVGKTVRTETKISSGAASLGYVALLKIRQEVVDPAQLQVAIVGAGTVARSVALNLKEAGVQSMTVFHRGSDRARSLATNLQAAEAYISDLASRLADFDIVITATSHGDVLISREMVEQAQDLRQSRGMLLLDLAMPRNVDPAAAEVAGVTLLHMDDLESLVQETLSDRAHWIPAADAIVRAGVHDFSVWLQHRRMAPMMQDLQHLFDGLKQQTLDSLDDLEPAAYARVARSLEGMVGRMVGGLAKYVRESHHERLDAELGQGIEATQPQIREPQSVRKLNKASGR